MTSLRDQINAAIARADVGGAVASLGRLFREQPTLANAAFVNARFEQLQDQVPALGVRLAILRSFTIEPLIPLLRARCWLAGLSLTVQVGDFNVVDQELMQAESALYRFQPDVIAVAVMTSDISSALWAGSGSFDDDRDRAQRRVRCWIEACRRFTAAPMVIQSFEEPAWATAGVLDAQRRDNQRRAVRGLNDALAEAAREHRSVFILDYDALVARHGRSAWRDPHKHLSLGVPLRADAFGWLAEEYMRFLRPLTGRICKVAVVDLDDTLWGGIVGEVGPDSVQIGADYPGNAFREFQRELKALSGRGIVLAICSKNNQDDVAAVFRERGEMVLRLEDFAAVRVGWDDKATGLRALASELNVGLDALAFLDDNPVEREWIRAELPEVHVIDLPPDPVLYAEAVRSAPVFERLALSDEDSARPRQYAEQRSRREAAQETGSVEDFLKSLDMKASLEPMSAASLARVVQLTQKTNQFNLTTKRYSEEALARAAAEPGVFVRTVRITDRFGDTGLVGVAVARVAGAVCEIDTFLLSCRVIGRQVETALLSDVVDEARSRGATTLRGWYRPTAKNAPARELYRAHGFSSVTEESGAVLWELDLVHASIAVPAWIERTVPA